MSILPAGMDDTNFDLSQYHGDPTGSRSMPTTPVPIVSVTEASPPATEEPEEETAETTPQSEVAPSESSPAG